MDSYHHSHQEDNERIHVLTGEDALQGFRDHAIKHVQRLPGINTNDIEEFLRLLSIGHAQLWIATKNSEPYFSGVTTVQNLGDKKILEVHAVVGRNMRDVFKFFPSFVRWAEHQGVQAIYSESVRPAARMLKKLGFTPLGTNTEGKELLIRPIKE